MDTEVNDSTAITESDDLDAFSADFFGGSKAPEPVETEAPDDDANDTSPSDADDTNELSDTEADSDSNEEDEEPETPLDKPKKKTAQERISEVVGERNAARAELEAIRQELEALRAPKPKEEAPAVKDTPSVVPVKGAPDPDAVDENGESLYPLGQYDPKFLEDHVQWLFETKEAEQEAKRAQIEAARQKEVQLTALQSDWQTKLKAAEAQEGMADLREKGQAMLAELDSIITDESYGEFLGKTIMGMEKGVEVFNFLANNLDIAKNLATLDVVNATITLGAIQERVSKRDGNNVKPRVSAAPEPPKTVNRGNHGRFEVPDDTDDLDAFANKFFVKRK